MEKIFVYLGSDHVIQQPVFDLREKKLTLSATREAAVRQACSQDAAGIVNVYALDLESLRVHGGQQENARDCDVALPGNGNIAICSEAALQALEFSGATFVCM